MTTAACTLRRGILCRARHTFALFVPVLFLSALVSDAAHAQAPPTSASELIRLLSDNRPNEESPNEIHMFTCGETDEDRRDRALARQLALLESANSGQLDEVLGSIEKSGQGSAFFKNTGWFSLAYASARGPAAVPRLRSMIQNPKLATFRVGLDRAVALSLGITSYISSLREGEPTTICRRGEPRDALDKLIASLERNDRSELESGLGPSALSSLNEMLVKKSWSMLYRDVWHTTRGLQSAVGYLFDDVSGRWAEPEETLDETRGYGKAPLSAEAVTLNTKFTTARGRECGSYAVEFQKIKEPPGLVSYRINNSNLEGLLRLVNACFVQ
jgi:hypothetical protein